MYSIPLVQALAQLAPLSEGERQALLNDTRLTRLAAVFASLPDPRARRGQRYSLPFLLTCFVAALLCNCNSTHAVEQWCAAHQLLLAHVFGPMRFLTPSGSLYRRLLPRLSVERLEWALAAWVRATRPQEDREPVAVDGTRRCAERAQQSRPRRISWHSAPTRARKRCCKSRWGRRPMQSRSPKP